MFRLPFLENTSPPPFYQPHLSAEDRLRLDKCYIGNRSQAYYLKRFAEIDTAQKLIPRWHWTALVATFGWLLYRKRYLDCLVYCVAGLSFVKLTIVVSLAMLEFFVVRHLGAELKMPVRIMVGGGIWFFWACQVARWADAYYYRMARREIADALALHPYDKQAQADYLAYHGGVSIFGLLLGFAIYVVLVAIVAFHFVPFWADSKEREIIHHSYQILSHTRAKVEHIYQTTHTCPTALPFASTGQGVTIQVVQSVAGVQTNCAIVLTIKGASYPVRYLNGQELVMYRKPDGAWRCQSSLVKKQKPTSCVG